LIEKIISFAVHLTSIALIGAGGIGKTSIALYLLHDSRIKQWFGDNRWFIRCDKFTPSLTNFLGCLSKVLSAGIEHPDGLTSLRHFLSSKEMLIVLDNAESILDPQGVDAQEIYDVVEELSQFGNICLCITSRITTVPSSCKILDIPTLSMEAGCNAFYHIYKNREQSHLVSNILKQLDFHPLSITLLATVAHHNRWNVDQLTKEWGRKKTAMLCTKHNRGLAAMVELSLSSPMFQELGPNAHELLGVVAFFPQGVNEDNLDWLFPTISNRIDIFNTFCILCLTYRSNGFVTMLAPLQDHLCPKDPRSSPLLCMTKEQYFCKLFVEDYPDKPGVEDAQWITSEDVNVEHLLNIFISIDPNSDEVWDACHHFMQHLTWHKPRPVVVGPKIKGLADGHPSKAKCLSQLAWLLYYVGNHVESKQLLVHALKLWREQGNDFYVAETLWRISGSNRMLHLDKEGIQQAKEAFGIYKQFNDISGQARSLSGLARLLHNDGQPNAAERAATQVIDCFSSKGEQFSVCECYRTLGDIYHSTGKTKEALTHFRTALRIASGFNWTFHLLWTRYSLARLSFDKGRFDDAHAHIEYAKSHTINDTYGLGRVVELQAWFWYKQQKFEEARSAALHAADVYQGLGAAKHMEDCRALLRKIARAER
jgi:tetratricopeptide (TPR) repeat protein